MGRVIILDTSPLGSASRRRGIPEADACRLWLRRCRENGNDILAPAIAFYEVARELERNGSQRGLERLEEFCATDCSYLPLTDTALRIAIKLWARARNAGTPTADPKALDCDVLIAAQALDLGRDPEDLIVATSNPAHLGQFVAADLWQNIVP
jgi:predicted nucleic acid-binding protein